MFSVLVFVVVCLLVYILTFYLCIEPVDTSLSPSLAMTWSDSSISTEHHIVKIQICKAATKTIWSTSRKHLLLSAHLWMERIPSANFQWQFWTFMVSCPWGKKANDFFPWQFLTSKGDLLVPRKFATDYFLWHLKLYSFIFF